MPALRVLGLMSGSSLDGLDLALCRLEIDPGRPAAPVRSWSVETAATLPFSEQWIARLTHLPRQSGLVYAKTHTYFGHYLAELTRAFLAQADVPAPDLVASHGHTVFHAPERRMSAQIGDGAALAALLQLPVACDFRTQDVALDGEGAPLAALADRLLFPGYQAYLNLGGIANLSIHRPNQPVRAFDVTGANQPLNALAQLTGTAYDAGGQLAASGRVDEALLAALGASDFFQQPPPKSLSNQWVREHLTAPLLAADHLSVPDRLRTTVAHTVSQLAAALADYGEFTAPQMLVTGGGAHNSFLIDELRAALPAWTVAVPERQTVDFKEAALMALMGALRWYGLPNVDASATGARRATVSGALHFA